MARTRKTQKDHAPAAPTSAPPTPARAPTELPWERRKWHDLDLYICRHCNTDLFDAGDMYEHVRTKHPGALPDHT